MKQMISLERAGSSDQAAKPRSAASEVGSEEKWDFLLRDGERMDDLQVKGLQILQRENGFCFGMDAVLLSAFAKIHAKERVIDLCTGNGIIPLLLSAKTPAEQITGVELLPENADLARRSVLLNGLEDRITIVEGDVKGISGQLGEAAFDVVTCNPPYMKGGHGLDNADRTKTFARHEVALTLEEMVKEAAKLLRMKGRAYFVHRPFRMTELVVAMHQYGLEAKTMRFVYPFSDKEPNMVLVEGVRGAKPYLRVQAPLVVYEAPDVYTQEVKRMYSLE